MFRTNSETLRGIFGLPVKNQNASLQKNDCCNMLSDCCQEVCSAIQRRFLATIGAKVGLRARLGILKKGFFFQKIDTRILRPRPELHKCVTSMIFQGLLVFFAWRAWKGSPQLKISLRFFVFEKSFFLKHHGDL